MSRPILQVSSSRDTGRKGSMEQSVHRPLIKSGLFWLAVASIPHPERVGLDLRERRPRRPVVTHCCIDPPTLWHLTVPRIRRPLRIAQHVIRLRCSVFAFLGRISAQMRSPSSSIAALAALAAPAHRAAIESRIAPRSARPCGRSRPSCSPCQVSESGTSR